jgi:hypothetical protein
MASKTLKNTRFVVELVGPGGVGKTSVAFAIRVSPDITLLRPTDYANVNVLARSRAIFKIITLAVKHRLRRDMALSLARKCFAVEFGLTFLPNKETGIVVLDEGPIRILRDMCYASYRERRAWHEYAQRTLAWLCRQPINVLVIRLDLNESTRSQRFHARTAYDRAQPVLNKSISSIAWRCLDYLCGRKNAINIATLRDEIDQFIAREAKGTIRLVTLSIAPQESPEAIAGRVLALIRENRMNNSPCANGADDVRPFAS